MNTQEPKTLPVILEAILAAVDAEPELPDAMPSEMLDAVRNPDTAAEALRIMVRLTKRGIRERILSALSLPPTTSKATVKDSLTVAATPEESSVDRSAEAPGVVKAEMLVFRYREHGLSLEEAEALLALVPGMLETIRGHSALQATPRGGAV